MYRSNAFKRIRPPAAIGLRPPSTHLARLTATAHEGSLAESHFGARRDVVGSGGRIPLRHGGRLHHIGVGWPNQER